MKINCYNPLNFFKAGTFVIKMLNYYHCNQCRSYVFFFVEIYYTCMKYEYLFLFLH